MSVKCRMSAVFLVLFLAGCITGPSGSVSPSGALSSSSLNKKGEFVPITLTGKFFWQLSPWKNGTLVTIDGWGRFSEIVFSGEKNYKLKTFVNFPRRTMDEYLSASGDASLIYNTSGKMVLVADTQTNTTKSWILVHSWAYGLPGVPVWLDPKEKIFCVNFNAKIFIYNFKTGADEKEIDADITILQAIDTERTLAWTSSSLEYDELTWKRDYFIFNWKTEEKTQNPVTKMLSELNLNFIESELSLENNCILTESNGKAVFISWDDNFENPRAKFPWYALEERISSILIAPNGAWATMLVDSGERDEYYNEQLYKRVFFHIDKQYPDGISAPLFAEGYFTDAWDQGAFFNHPVYGFCYADGFIKGKKSLLDLYRMSDVLAELQKKEAANTEFSSADILSAETLARIPDDAISFCGRGDVFYEKGCYDLAVVDYTTAIKLDSGNVNFYLSRAQAQKKRYRNKEAIKDYTRAIAIKPVAAELYRMRGKAYFDDNKYDEALQDYGTVMEITPDDPWAYNNRGAVYYRQKKYDMAIADLLRASGLKSNNEIIWYNLAYVCAANKDYDAAIAYVTEAIKLNPDDLEAWNLCSKVAVRKGNYEADAVLRGLLEALEPNPDSKAVQGNLDYIQGRKGGENPPGDIIRLPVW